MKYFIIGSAALVILVGLVLTLYNQPFFNSQEEVQISANQETVSGPEETVVRYPVDEREVATEPETAEEESPKIEEPLPSLPESDETLQELLTRTLDDQKLLSLLHLKNFIQRFVVTIDSLPEKQISQHHLPVAPPKGKFLVVGGSISPDNAKRYSPYIQLADYLGTEQVISIYVHFYDLFQEAYRELGYPKKYFNDRFVEVIDHLLDTPEIKDPIGVIQPLIVYKYTNPVLENLSAGQKLMLRMGSENRTKTKEILRNLRKRLTSLGRSKQG